MPASVLGPSTQGWQPAGACLPDGQGIVLVALIPRAELEAELAPQVGNYPPDQLQEAKECRQQVPRARSWRAPTDGHHRTHRAAVEEEGLVVELPARLVASLTCAVDRVVEPPRIRDVEVLACLQSRVRVRGF